MPGFRHVERTPGPGRKKRHPLSVRGGFATNAIDAATAYPLIAAASVLLILLTLAVIMIVERAMGLGEAFVR
jgi:hypothetical protein